MDTTAARTSDVWRGWIAPGGNGRKKVVGGGEGRGRTGYEGASYRVANVILGAQGDFVGWLARISAFIRVVSSSFRRWISRLASASGSPAVASLAAFDLPFFGISPRTRDAVPPRRIELKCDLSTSVRKSTAKRSRVLHVSRNREIIEPSVPCISMLNISILSRLIWLSDTIEGI